MTRRSTLIRSLGLALFALGCSGGNKIVGEDDGSQSKYNNTDTGGSSGTNPSQVNVEFVGTSGNDCSIRVNGATCLGMRYEPESTPLDIYVMFDQTGSTLSCVDPTGVPGDDPRCKMTRINAVRNAMAQFMADPESTGIGIGIGYFGQFPIGSADCRDSTYASPAVVIGELPDNATAMMTSLNSVVPTGETPTAAAIRGACSYATSWKKSHIGHRVVMLLVTDGLPEAPVSCPASNCCPTLDDAVKAAQECLNDNRGIQTYVLGVGPYLENLQQIAVGGGTNNAYLVGSGDVATQVLQALNTIRSAAMIPCSLTVPTPPSGQQIAYDQVNIAYADPSCQGTVFSKVSSVDACGGDMGWYYDDPSAPKQVELCPTSCSRVSVAGARLMFTVGCETIDSTIIN